MILRVDYIALVLSPVHHGGNEKTGNLAMMRRMPFVIENEIVEIPYIDGNAVRGRLRRLAARDLMERLDFAPKTDIVYHMLMSGGALEDAGAGSGKVNVEFNKRIRSLLPTLSLLGTSYLNQALAGKLCVGHMLPYCEELVRGGFVEPMQQTPPPIHQLLPWTHGTRRDDREIQSENVQQMIFEYEVFMPGTLLVGDFVIRYPTTLETSAFAHLLQLWSDFPTVGARGAQGHGRLRLLLKDKLSADPHQYLHHLEQNGKQIRALLEELDAFRATSRQSKIAYTDTAELPMDSC